MQVTGTVVSFILSGALLSLAASSVHAQQDYPNKPIRMIVGVAPGGATDILARASGARLGEVFRQQIVVENRPGVNHIIGGELTAKSARDGYTIQMIPEGFVINASVYAKLPFDPVKDFSPIALVANVPNVLVVHPSLPVRNVKSFIAIARSRPAELNYGSVERGVAESHVGRTFQGHGERGLRARPVQGPIAGGGRSDRRPDPISFSFDSRIGRPHSQQASGTDRRHDGATGLCAARRTHHRRRNNT